MGVATFYTNWRLTRNRSGDFSLQTQTAVRLYIFILAYLKDSNAAAHSVDSDIFQSSDSSICALQDLTLTFIS